MPRSIKNALDMDYVFVSIYNKYNKRIRVTMKPRFGRGSIYQQWISRDYFKRNYPKTYSRL